MYFIYIVSSWLSKDVFQLEKEVSKYRILKIYNLQKVPEFLNY